MTKRNKTSNVHKRITFKVAILLLAFYLVYSMISLQTELVAERKVLTKAQDTISSYKISNKELKDLLENGSQKELVERAAREKIGFVYANEEIYEDIKGN